jgi:hypothetical protein
MLPLGRWTKQVLSGLFYRSEETPRVLRWIYDAIDEDFDDEAAGRSKGEQGTRILFDTIGAPQGG